MIKRTWRERTINSSTITNRHRVETYINQIFCDLHQLFQLTETQYFYCSVKGKVSFRLVYIPYRCLSIYLQLRILGAASRLGERSSIPRVSELTSIHNDREAYIAINLLSFLLIGARRNMHCT